jgi:hypothetical protein
MWRFDIVQVWIGLFMLGRKVFNIEKLLKYAFVKGTTSRERKSCRCEEHSFQ